MAAYSTNQVRHLYVVKAVKESHLTASDAVGTIYVGATDDVIDNKLSLQINRMYFEYMSPAGIVRSDLIPVEPLAPICTATSLKKLRRELKSYTVTLDPNINGGAPVAGQDYVLRIAFRQFIGMSDEDFYFKYGMVHSYAGMTASDFYKKLAISLAKNFSREVVPLVKFTLITESNSPIPVDAVTKESDLTGTYKSLSIEEVEQPWRLGVMAQTPVYFTVQPTTVIVSGDEVIWGVVEEKKSTSYVGNGKSIADLEYFCMGERGDMYRNIAWPHNIPTTYLVDSSLEYDVIDMNYYFEDKGMSPQKSERTITLVAAGTESNHTLANNIITKINDKISLDMATIS